MCVFVCVCVCVCVQSQTPFSSCHESGQSLFLSTGKHPGVGRLPQVSFFAQPGQSSNRPNLPPHKRTFDFSVSFRQYTENALGSMQWPREAKNRSFNIRTVKSEEASEGHHHGPLSGLVLDRRAL